MSSDVVCSKTFLTKFIEIYKEHPALWKIKSKEYTNKNLKNRAYSALIDYCKLSYPEADRNFVSKKIQNLRGCFRKELKKVEASLRSGTGADDVYEPHLWYYDLLLFTTDQEMPVQSVDSENLLEESQFSSQLSDLTEHEDVEVEDAENVIIGTTADEEFVGSNSQMDETENIIEETGDIPVPVNNSQRVCRAPAIAPPKQVNSNRKRKYEFQQQQQQFMKTCTEVLQQKETVDEFQAIGINVASKLQKMTPNQQVLAEGLIHKILMKGIFNELTRTTDISNGFVTLESNVYDQSSNSSTLTPSPLTSPDSGLSHYYTNTGQTLQHAFSKYT